MMKCIVTALASILAAQPRPSCAKSARLETSLRMYRAEQAYIRAIPASTVYGDKLMGQIISTRPSTLKQLMSIRGIGAARVQNYGKDLVRLVKMDDRAQKVKALAAHSLLSMSNSQGKRSPSQGKLRKKPISTARPRTRPRPKPKPKPCPYGTEASIGALNTSSTEDKLPLSLVSSTLPVKSPPTSVYILELEGGRVYVGSSRNVKRRINQHKSGVGSAYTKSFKPTGTLLPRLGNVQGSGDAAERDETLRYMYLRGIPLVRGWKFSQVNMSSADFEEAEANIRELFDLCRRCGRSGHFMTHCPSTIDRWGRSCTK